MNIEEQGFRISNQLLSKSFDNKYVLADQVQFNNYLSGIGEEQFLSKSCDDRCVLGDQVQKNSMKKCTYAIFVQKRQKERELSFYIQIHLFSTTYMVVREVSLMLNSLCFYF